MWLVTAALRRPLTILTLLIALVLTAGIAIRKMPIDIFPVLGIPVIYVAQPYGGLDPSQMEGFISSYYEYHFLYITGIKEVESRSIQDVALIKLEFYPGTNMSQAMAETVAYVNRARAFMPPGTVSPFVVRFDAGSVPVGNLVFSSKTRSLGEIQDLALYKVRPMFASLPGVSAPPPMGGNQRTIVVHIDPSKLQQYHLSADKVVQAISNGNTIAPSGTVRIGDKALLTSNNAVVPDIKSLEDIAIEPNEGATVYLHDIGWVENSSDILTSYALVNGKRAIFIPVTKRSDASTWTVVQEVKNALPSMQDAIPSDIKVAYEFDQSGYVKEALLSLFIESVLGALLTGLMIFIFLRDFYSSMIVIITIPTAILGAIFGLWLTGQTINIMTLGGLALAVGILVDQATVTIENIHTHYAQGKSSARAVVDSSREVSFTVFLVLICVLAVFIPSFFMTGITGSLFIPLSLAVGFAMVTSFLLSQTLVPIMVIKYLKPAKQQNASSWFQTFKEKYTLFLKKLFPTQRLIIIFYFIGCFALLIILTKLISIELFPSVDTGQFRMRVRAPAGTRVEHTEEIVHQLLDTIATQAGEKNVDTSLAFVGTQPPSYPINTIYLWTDGPFEAVISVALKNNSGIKISQFKEQLRNEIAKKFPDLSISFEPGDLVGQVTNLGAQTPIEIAIIGKSIADNKLFANKLKMELKKIKEMRDLQFGETLNYPALSINIDRIRAGQLGITVDQISKALTPATSSSRFTSPNYWLDTSTGTAYQVQVEIPQSKMQSIENVKEIPVILNPSDTGPFLRDVASVEPTMVMGEAHRLNNQRILTLTANIQGNDLKKAANNIQKAIQQAGNPPRGMKVEVRSQIKLLLDTLDNLEVSLFIAVMAIFLLLAANFQSFMLALLSLTTVPAVLVGSELILLFTGSSLNIQSYLGTIMAIGVSVANSIILITFAEQLRKENNNSMTSAIEGATKRLRPILMTAIAMIMGMTPMALGLSGGGEQTAPLGRAVIGGLLASTMVTLLVLPLVFAAMCKRSSILSISLDPDDPDGSHYEHIRK
ncbi:efflux RND transporter permease subunit [Fluoribacter dumoffii]|uniref:Multidrug transporter MdtC n=1 Tax=Fluoribacter dumoffii TaxID=463 RepID=A0A377IUL8_9GAMM|nr:efflux RND transporter permease subunit [Fluoribacter dumoffii]KTC89165.1 cation/multidrug efflux pump [Fluoribacter dumoffii NY 23]STO91563.1 Multidrug transporter MdtC [Fluoribacter dumoffii]